MEKLTFTHNWNNKLDCVAFTTLRLRNDRKYYIGGEVEVLEKHFSRGAYKIVDIKHFKIFQINEFMARVDTGYSRERCIEVIQTMYKNIVTNWNTQELSLILLTKSSTI